MIEKNSACEKNVTLFIGIQGYWGYRLNQFSLVGIVSYIVSLEVTLDSFYYF